jgi:hypothetical protein
MGATVVVIDTNQIRDFPMFRSRDWDELLSKAEDWDLRIALPEVCLQEAISVVRRKWTEKRGQIKKIHVNELGLGEQGILDEIDSKIAGYEDALKTRLTEIGAEIVPIPESVEILDVMQRAIDRRAPYSEGKKDGFRDTLIWHTARRIAADDTDCEVWLVSANHTDFGDKTEDLEACPYPLHPHLIEDLEADELSDRVSYVRTVGRLKQHLAGTYDGLPPDDLEALANCLSEDEFEAHLSGEVLGLMVNNAAAALPLRTVDGIIDSYTSDPDSREFVDAALRGGGVWTAQFNESIQATVALIDVDGDTSSIEKTLNVAGRLEAGTDGSVKELIVTSVEALPNDPMRRAYQTLGLDSAFSADYLKTIPSDLGLHMQAYLRTIQPDLGPNMQEYLRSIQPDLGNFDAQEIAKSFQIDPREIAKSFQIDPQEIAKSFQINAQHLMKSYYDSLPKPQDLLKSYYDSLPKPGELLQGFYESLPRPKASSESSDNSRMGEKPTDDSADTSGTPDDPEGSDEAGEPGDD